MYRRTKIDDRTTKEKTMGALGSRTSGRMRRLGGLGVLLAGIPMVLGGGADAASRNIGAGVVHGTTEFLGNGIPPATPPSECVPVNFTVDATTAAAVAMNTVITGYAGTLHIYGTGSTDCTSTTASGGELFLSVTGTGPTGSQIDCGRAPFPQMTGGFTRVGVEVLVQITGTCVINKYGIAAVRFAANLVFTPTQGTGINDPITQANFDGPFVIVPLG